MMHNLRSLTRNVQKQISYLMAKSFVKSVKFIPRHPEKWTEYMHIRKSGDEKNVPSYDKMQTAKIIREMGFRTTEILRIFNDSQKIDFSGLPDKFVLKPSCLFGCRGVMLLHCCSDEFKFWEVMGNRWLTLDMVRDEQSKWQDLWYKNKKQPFHLIVEEMVTGENGIGKIPFDYRLYTFDGEVRFIIQVDFNAKPPAMI